MSDNSNLTCKEFLEAILAKASVVAKDPELFTIENGWKSLTDELDKLVDKLSKKENPDEKQQLMCERDVKVRNLIILMRVQLAQSYLFDDLQLQASQGCTILRDYADLNPRPSNFGGHQCDGIKWTEIERSMMPDHPKRRFDFRGTVTEGWEYCSCLDHAISNLICKVWGFSGFNDGKILKPSPSASFTCNDASLYLAVLLCFGDNILDDQKFLREIGANLDKNDTPQKKLYKVLSVSKIRGELWERIQGHIKEDDSMSPDQP